MDICSEALCLYISLWHKVLLKSKLNEICSQMTKVGTQKWEKWDWTGIELNNCGYFELQLYQNHLIYEKTEYYKSLIYAKKLLHVYIFPIPLSLPSSVQFSRSVMSNSLWPHESQHARPPCPSPTPGVELVMPSNHLILCHPSPSLPAPNPSQHQGLFQWVNFSHEVAKVLEF